jgi:LmbE family N-acetylglucosaminyl deacetylase
MPSKNLCSHLLVVAHPDDETLFFGGLLQSLKDWHVVCVTDGNADGLGSQRQEQFFKAIKLLRVKKSEIYNFEDKFETRLNTYELVRKLSGLGKFKKVFTHSIVGEYGHPHHQDVSFATHQAFNKISPIYSVAYNCFPELKISLTKKQFELKTKILWDIYSGETKRLINYLPAHSQESFSKISYPEIESIYFCLSQNKPLDKKLVKAYKWFVPYLESGNANLNSRPF